MHEELIEFIEFTLFDGKISDKELKVILKKAKELGVDKDECEVLIDTCIQKKNQSTSIEKSKTETRKIDFKPKVVNPIMPADLNKQADFENNIKKINIQLSKLNKQELGEIKKVEDYIASTSKPVCIIFSSDLPHGPYPKSSDYNNKPLDYDPSSKTISSKIGNHKAGYYQNIEDDNDQLGRVLNMLETVSDLDESVFIYISDHGLKGKWSVRETGLKIPMVFRWPNVIPPNTTNHKLVSIVDILPTIIEISGGEKIENLDGKSLVPILSNTNVSFRDYIFGIATRQNIQKCYVFPSGPFVISDINMLSISIPKNWSKIILGRTTISIILSSGELINFPTCHLKSSTI